MEDFFCRIWNLTSYLRNQVLHILEDLVFGNVDLPHPSGVSPSGLHLRSSFGSTFQAVPDDCYVPSSAHTCAGQTLPVPGKRKKRLKKSFPVNISAEIGDANNCSHIFPVDPSIFQGLMIPIFSLKLAWRFTFVCWKRFLFLVRCIQIKTRSLVSRVQKTLQGSSDDIGWLQRTPGMPPVKDGTARFMDLLHDIRNGKHTLPDSFVYLLIPGLFSNLSPLYFVSTKRFFSKMGLACHIAKIHSEAAVDRNAWELKQYIEELYWGSGKRVMLLGHSKGGVDAAAALSVYSLELKDKVAGLALVQSPYGGSPIASDVLREGQIADKETRKIMELLICKLIKGDMQALEDLTYEKRKEFIMNHKLPENIPLVSFNSEASTGPGVFSTMSHIAHAEIPWLTLPSFGNGDLDSIQAGCKVPVVIPLAAVMAVSALHLKLRYGEKSDGLVTCRDAIVPDSVVVHPERKLHHAWMVCSSWKKDRSEPDASEMCEALLTLLVEIGKMKDEQGEWNP
ncbi:alpha/beta-Hydrolases superfamily protein [Thalictrum thalictroides]|uniref:Alpha/beta-Hydrolases superfamily protein n=1 Tax=Thalictrum thalictroides TaxID=46969 RepID=A0A7J6UW76_THATH|nr:alpha/beta-Hydrolases superfamily protein [Thalictrum thalictroides]